MFELFAGDYSVRVYNKKFERTLILQIFALVRLLGLNIFIVSLFKSNREKLLTILVDNEVCIWELLILFFFLLNSALNDFTLSLAFSGFHFQQNNGFCSLTETAHLPRLKTQPVDCPCHVLDLTSWILLIWDSNS